MPELALGRKERRARRFERLDNALCVAVFIGASLPALVVMVLIAFPLLPLFGVWVSWIASTGGPMEGAGYEKHRTDEMGPVDHPRGHAPTPHYA